MPAKASIYRQPNPLLRASFPLLVLFLFAIYSATFEMIPGLRYVRPQFIMAVLGLLAIFGTGRFLKVITSRIGMCVVAFTIWFIACVPFGMWPGGSVHIFLEQWYKTALIFLMAAGLITTLPQANTIFYTIAYGTGLLSIITLLKHTYSSEGRLILDNTRYLNPNDLAWTLLIGLTFIAYVYLRGTPRQKGIAVLMALPMLFAISRTGSRAAAIAAVLLFLSVLWQSKPSTRVRLLAITPIVLMALIVLMPRDTLLRYTTYFGHYSNFDMSAENKVLISTIGSSEARMRLLIDSLLITARHPLLGVGPGNFVVAQDVLAKARGEARGLWHVPHNTYTHLSSEMGLPGLAIYVAMLYFVFRTLNSIIRTRSRGRAWADLKALALCLRTAFIMFLPVGFFDSLAYNADVPILAGITVAIGFMAQKQLAIDRANETAARVQALTPADVTLEPVTAGTY